MNSVQRGDLILAVVLVGTLAVGIIIETGGPTGGGCSTSVGSRVELGASGMSTVPVAQSAEALDKMIEAAAADDETGYRLEMLAGAALVSTGTEAQVVNASASGLKVRVVDGPDAGRSGWIVDEWVRC